MKEGKRYAFARDISGEMKEPIIGGRRGRILEHISSMIVGGTLAQFPTPYNLKGDAAGHHAGTCCLRYRRIWPFVGMPYLSAIVYLFLLSS